MMHFVGNFDYACLRRLWHIAMKRFKIMAKFNSFKALLKMAGGGVHPPQPSSGSVLAHPFNLQIPPWEPGGLFQASHRCSSLKSKAINDAIEGIDCIKLPTQREINSLTTIT